MLSCTSQWLTLCYLSKRKEKFQGMQLSQSNSCFFLWWIRCQSKSNKGSFLINIKINHNVHGIYAYAREHLTNENMYYRWYDGCLKVENCWYGHLQHLKPSTMLCMHLLVALVTFLVKEFKRWMMVSETVVGYLIWVNSKRRFVIYYGCWLL